MSAPAPQPATEPPPPPEVGASARRPRRLTGVWIALAVLLLAGAAAYGLMRRPEAVVITVEVREVVDHVVVSGRLRAVREAAVGVEIGGTVEEVMAREGDRAVTGQELARIGLVDYEAQRQQARARRDSSAAEAAVAALLAGQSKEDLRRTEELSRSGVLAVAELETARNAAARLEAAEAAARARREEDEGALRLLDRQLEKRIVRAPFAGTVTRRSVEPGQSVGPGTALFLLAEMARTEIYAETDENNVGRLRAGQPATVIAPAFRTTPFQARLTQIGPRIDWDRGVVGLRLTPENPPDFLLPNMTVDVSIEVARLPAAQTLPVSAVLRSRAGDFVLIATGDRFERRAIKVIGENPTTIAVENLPAGSRVAREATKVDAGERYRMTAPP